MSGSRKVHSTARVAATLRTIVAGFRQGGEHALPVLVGEHDGGDPEAAIMPYDLFVSLCQALERAEESMLGNSQLIGWPLLRHRVRVWTTQPWHVW